MKFPEDYRSEESDYMWDDDLGPQLDVTDEVHAYTGLIVAVFCLDHDLLQEVNFGTSLPSHEIQSKCSPSKSALFIPNEFSKSHKKVRDHNLDSSSELSFVSARVFEYSALQCRKLKCLIHQFLVLEECVWTVFVTFNKLAYYLPMFLIMGLVPYLVDEVLIDIV